MKCAICGEEGSGKFCAECGAPMSSKESAPTPIQPIQSHEVRATAGAGSFTPVNQLRNDKELQQALTAAVLDVLRAHSSLSILHLAPIDAKLWKKAEKAIGDVDTVLAETIALINLRCDNWIIFGLHGVVCHAHLPLCGSNTTQVSYVDLASMPLAFGPGQLGTRGTWCDPKKTVPFGTRVLFYPGVSGVPPENILTMMRKVRDAVRSQFLIRGAPLPPLND